MTTLLPPLLFLLPPPPLPLPLPLISVSTSNQGRPNDTEVADPEKENDSIRYDDFSET
jgi:hypothetical protein